MRSKKTLGGLILAVVMASIFSLTVATNGLYEAASAWAFALVITALVFLGVKWLVEG